MNIYRLLLVAALFAIGVAPKAAHAYDFIPTEAEFYAWPTYCQARYATVEIAQTTQFPNKVPRAQIEMWKTRLTDDVFVYIHHHCAGLIWSNRAKYESNPATRKFYYRTALQETTFTFTRTPIGSELAPSMLIALANASQGIGDPESAEKYLQQAIEAQPANSAAYVALALLYRNDKRLNEARDTLVTGNNATGDNSAELNYNLALILLELKQDTEAVDRARKAYDLGYPLPGLRNKLIKQGIWKTPELARKD